MNDRRIDLAHAVALGLIDDEDHHAIQNLIDDPAQHAEFVREVRYTRAVLAEIGSTTPVTPPPELRTRLLAAIAEEDPVAS